MADTKYILEKIRIEGELKELLAKTSAELVACTYNGKETTLAGALAEIFTSLEELPEMAGEATAETAGLMSAADKARLDGLRGVRYGTQVPADMKDGELFVRVVETAAE